jgi:hypothetical protein
MTYTQRHMPTRTARQMIVMVDAVAFEKHARTSSLRTINGIAVGAAVVVGVAGADDASDGDRESIDDGCDDERLSHAGRIIRAGLVVGVCWCMVTTDSGGDEVGWSRAVFLSCSPCLHWRRSVYARAGGRGK